MYQISHWENSNLYKKKKKKKILTLKNAMKSPSINEHLSTEKKIFPHGNNPHFLTGEVLLQPDQN